MPWFADEARPDIRPGAQTCDVTFPQATDREVVVSYIVEIVVADNLNETVARQRVFSQYYLNSRKPGKLTVHFSNLPAGKQLCTLVTAVNPYHRLSLPIKSDCFSF
jgi:hypothetical protein